MVSRIKMVESNRAVNIDDVNLDQLVFLKAYQSGHLQFSKKITSVPGYIFGRWNKLLTFEETSSFLPFTPKDCTRYRPAAPFTDLRRPYRPGYEAPPSDDGSQYAASEPEWKQELRTYIHEATEPLKVDRVDLTCKPVAVIYNPTSGKGRNIREIIQTRLAECGIECHFFET